MALRVVYVFQMNVNDYVCERRRVLEIFATIEHGATLTECSASYILRYYKAIHRILTLS